MGSMWTPIGLSFCFHGVMKNVFVILCHIKVGLGIKGTSNYIIKEYGLDRPWNDLPRVLLVQSWLILNPPPSFTKQV